MSIHFCSNKLVFFIQHIQDDTIITKTSNVHMIPDPIVFAKHLTTVSIWICVSTTSV